MRSFSFNFGKKKKKGDNNDDYATLPYRKNSDDTEKGRKRRRQLVEALLTMTLSEEMQTDLLWDVSQGFDLPLVIGEQFICKIRGKEFQSASYHACLTFILTTLYAEKHAFAINIYTKLIQTLDPVQRCQLASFGFDVKTRNWGFREYKNCFVGQDAVSWLVDHKVCYSRDDAVKLGQIWLKCKLITHVTKDRGFEDKNYYYVFNENLKFFIGQPTEKIMAMIDSMNNNNDVGPGDITPQLKQTPSYSSRFRSINYPNHESPKKMKKKESSLIKIFGGH